MIGAFLTTIFWAISAVCAQRAARYLGSLTANSIRLVMAVAVLGIMVALFYRDTFAPRTFLWLAVSGIIGFGVGDIALFLALARLGSRLTVLITLCAAPLLAASIEWFWLGNALPPKQIAAAAVIVAGVCLTLKPSSPESERYGSAAVGLLMAFVSAFGQGFGAVLSRVATDEAASIGLEIPPLSQAFQRVLPGMIVSLLASWVAGRRVSHPVRRFTFRGDFGWLLGAALCGPVIGVAFYQWGLQEAESALVLVIVSLTPIVVMPMAWFVEKDRPGPLAIVGAVIAIGGAAAVAWLRSQS